LINLFNGTLSSSSFVPPGTYDNSPPFPTVGIEGNETVSPARDERTQTDKKKKVGTIGYSMGGPIVMRTAAAVPDRVGAAGTFHGGGLVTQKPDSPHLLIPTMKAQFLIAVAENDDEKEPETKKLLKEAFSQAKLPAEIEVYKAGHGWCPPDTKVYNQEQAEKAWACLLVLFEKSLA